MIILSSLQEACQCTEVTSLILFHNHKPDSPITESQEALSSPPTMESPNLGSATRGSACWSLNIACWISISFYKQFFYPNPNPMEISGFFFILLRFEYRNCYKICTCEKSYDIWTVPRQSAGIGYNSIMMSWHRNCFHITGPLWGESTNHWWITLIMGQWYGALMFSLILAKTDYWTNSPVASDLRLQDFHSLVISL